VAGTVMEKRYQKFKDDGYQQYLLIQQGSSFGAPATAALCKQIRQKYGLTFPVLYDPTTKLKQLYQGKFNEMNYVVGAGAKLLHKGQYTPSGTIESLLMQVLY
jgi:hypothetical protein